MGARQLSVVGGVQGLHASRYMHRECKCVCVGVAEVAVRLSMMQVSEVFFVTGVLV